MLGIFNFSDSETDNSPQELAALVSHHIRNPISAIKWSSEILINGDAGKLTEEQMSHIRAIAESNQRLLEVTEELVLAVKNGAIRI
jgi:two-component system, NtrC family, sensor histidine kinase KinB